MDCTMKRIFWNKGPELGAVCGRILKRGRIWGGGMEEDGSVLYAGLPPRYSRYMHRAVLCQEVAAGDILNASGSKVTMAPF